MWLRGTWISSVAVVCIMVIGFPLHTTAAPKWDIIPYEKSWEVSDPKTNNYQNWVEIKLPNGDVFGSYSVLLPNNEIHTTTYNVTGDKGYQQSRSVMKLEL
ncbi:hypothetical protein SK128_024402 [Halocaridina rubra]|uniref:Uncharacterized protein n=1 Tax=Halocaridina rubra TaxID=373956 RepID=A0AAN8WVG3_HALRR